MSDWCASCGMLKRSLGSWKLEKSREAPSAALAKLTDNLHEVN